MTDFWLEKRPNGRGKRFSNLLHYSREKQEEKIGKKIAFSMRRGGRMGTRGGIHRTVQKNVKAMEETRSLN